MFTYTEWKEIEYLVNNVPNSKYLQKKLTKLKSSMKMHTVMREPIGSLSAQTSTYYTDKDNKVIPYWLIYAMNKLERQGMAI